VTGIPDPFQVRVAQLALAAAQRHGFALGGGHALLAHGLVHRPTEDVDLFTDVDGGVRAATEPVCAALIGAGLSADRLVDDGDLAELFYGMDDAFEEIDVCNDEGSVRISLGRLSRKHTPVVMAVGPVLHLDDVLGSKVCALATRGEIRDYIDVAAALDHGYDRPRLVAMASDHDPSICTDDFVPVMRRLDALPDLAFAQYGLGSAAVAELRSHFADWAREPG
jgi:hypothetical protein